MPTTVLHAPVLIIGGGSGGISVAARLQRAGYAVTVVEPSPVHYHQPAFSLVGAGLVSAKSTVRTEASVMPRGVRWIQSSVVGVKPDAKAAILEDGREVSYAALVLATGLQLNWGAIPGLPEAMLTLGVSSNYAFDSAPKTWDMIRDFRGGRAVFTMPSAPFKCPSAAQKIAYLAADYWRQQGLLDKMQITLVLPIPQIYMLPEFSEVLARVADDYGIEVRLQSELVAVDSQRRVITVADLANAGATSELPYDILHVVPPQRFASWIADSGLAADAPGGVDVDQYTLRHKRYPEIFAIGDNAGTPNGKTGAAVRKQAPVVAGNVAAALKGKPLTAQYNGYAGCPISVSRNKVFLAEADYSMRPTPTIPFMHDLKPRRLMWLMTRYGLGPLYWELMLRGRA